MCSYLKLVYQLSHICKKAAEFTILLILIFRDLRLSTAEEETKDCELKCSKHLPNGVCLQLLCEWNCAPLPALFSSYILACHVLCRHFPTLPNFFFLPALHCAKDSVFGHRPVRLSFEILLSAWGPKTRFGFSECGPTGSCWCCPNLCLVD